MKTQAVVLVVAVLLLATHCVVGYEHNMHPEKESDHHHEQDESHYANHAEAPEDNFGDLQCEVCTKVVAPALYDAIVESEKTHHTLNLVRSVLQELPFKWTVNRETGEAQLREDNASQAGRVAAEQSDDEDYSHINDADPTVQEFVSPLMWDPQMSRQVSGFARVYHEYHDRQHLLEPLIEHVLCHCDESNTKLEGAMFQKLLVYHSVASLQEHSTHGSEDTELSLEDYERGLREDAFRRPIDLQADSGMDEV